MQIKYACPIICAFFFNTSSKYLMKDLKRQKSTAKFVFSDSFFVFVFGICNLISHLGSLSRAVFIKGYCHTGNIVSSHTQDIFGT